LLLAIWELATRRSDSDPALLPSPDAILRAGYSLGISGELLTHIKISAIRAGLGLALGGSLGFVLGLMTGVSQLAERLLDSSIQMIRTIPHLALIPLIILWLGIGEHARVSLVALGAFFPIYINTYHGVRSVDPLLLEMGAVYGLGPQALFRDIIFPGALPNILMGLRYALGVVWLTLIVAETIASTSGIGYLATNAREFMQTDIVILAILIYALLGKVADFLVRLLERRLLSWNPAYRISSDH